MKFKEIFRKNNFQEMKDLFFKRTQYHCDLVKKYLNKIMQLEDDRIDNSILNNEMMNHDESKYHEPEYFYYLHINYSYYLKNRGIKYNPGKDIEIGMSKASFWHVKHNEHHPEYWDDNYKADSEKIDARKMPLSYVACTVADWMAMDEELNGNIYEWVGNFIKTKCLFIQEQIDFIYELIDKVYL